MFFNRVACARSAELRAFSRCGNQSSHKALRQPVKALLLGTALSSALFFSAQGIAVAANVNCANTLYYCSAGANDIITVTTTVAAKTAPLQGYGVYMNSGGNQQYLLNDITISTTGSAADAIRTNSEANYFRANRLTITATGSSSDGLNIASNFNNNYDSVVYIRDYAKITVTSGVAVRANNYRNADANTVIILPDASIISVVGTGTASNSTEAAGYALYAGNRDFDTNGGTNNNTLGNSYVFVGANSLISTSTRNGHAVYANKGGLIQLGDGTDIHTTGQGAYALYAATEQQGTYTTNVRPGYIFLQGGLKVRADASTIVMQANGAGSIIANRAMDVPTIADTFTRTTRVAGLDKSTTHETSGVFDIVGKLDAINGGEISLNMADGSTFVGATDNHPTASTASTLNLKISGASSQWQINANSSLTSLELAQGAVLKPYRLADETTSYSIQGNVTNGGHINLADTTVGDTLKIDGDYVGNNGIVSLNTTLNAGGTLSNQYTDRLIINGNVSGTTLLNIRVTTNSSPAETSPDHSYSSSQGISLIQVSGTATENAFRLAGGYVTLNGQPYTYTLHAYGPGSSEGAADRNQRLADDTSSYWDYRLQSDYVDPNPKPGPGPGPTPGPTPGPKPVRSVAPQVSNYLLAPVALFQAGLMDISNLHRRLGEIRDDRATGRNSGTGEFFMRAYGGKYQYGSTRNAYNYGYDANIDYAAMQMGGNLYAFEGKNGVTRFGLAGSIGSLSFDPRRVYGTKSTRLDTWSVSAYASYLHDSGWYVDGVLSYGQFKGDVSNTLKGHAANLSGDSFSASLETGYPFKLGNGLVLEPQAQLIYQRLMFDRKVDAADGFKVALSSLDQITARVGARLSKTLEKTEKDQLITLYAKVNLLYSTTNDSKVFLGDTFRIGRLGSAIEGGLGVNAQISKNLSLYADAAYQHRLGQGGVSGVSMTGGLRYSF